MKPAPVAQFVRAINTMDYCMGRARAEATTEIEVVHSGNVKEVAFDFSDGSTLVVPLEHPGAVARHEYLRVPTAALFRQIRRERLAAIGVHEVRA